VAVITRVAASDRGNALEMGALLDGDVRVSTGNAGRAVTGGFQTMKFKREHGEREI
jgi:hypothetical protein